MAATFATESLETLTIGDIEIEGEGITHKIPVLLPHIIRLSNPRTLGTKSLKKVRVALTGQRQQELYQHRWA